MIPEDVTHDESAATRLLWESQIVVGNEMPRCEFVDVLRGVQGLGTGPPVETGAVSSSYPAASAPTKAPPPKLTPKLTPLPKAPYASAGEEEEPEIAGRR